jgi:hypothetical protein
MSLLFDIITIVIIVYMLVSYGIATWLFFFDRDPLSLKARKELAAVPFSRQLYVFFCFPALMLLVSFDFAFDLAFGKKEQSGD